MVSGGTADELCLLFNRLQSFFFPSQKVSALCRRHVGFPLLTHLLRQPTNSHGANVIEDPLLAVILGILIRRFINNCQPKSLSSSMTRHL